MAEEYSEIPQAPDLFNHPVPTVPVGTEMFNEAPPFDSMPDPIAPVYGDSDIGTFHTPVYNDDPLMRNREESMFSVVYDPEDSGTNAKVMYTCGVVIDDNEVHEIGGAPGTLKAVDSGEKAPLDDDIVWYVNVKSDRKSSTVSSKKDTSADFSVPIARMSKGRNGYIQQLHRGAIFIGGGGGGGKFPYKVTTTKEQDANKNWHTYAVIEPGGFRDTERKKVEIDGFKDGAAKKEIVTDGELPVLLEWEYTWPANTVTNAKLVVDDKPWDGKEVITPIESAEGTGKSKCAIAILTVTRNQQDNSLDATVKSQLVNTGLAAVWYSGYVDGVSGRVGQYAEVSTVAP